MLLDDRNLGYKLSVCKYFRSISTVFLKVGCRAPRGALKGCWGGRYGGLESETKIQPHVKTTIPYS